MRWYQYLGPWPLRPIVTFLALIAWFAAVSTGAQLTDPEGTSDPGTLLEVVWRSALVAAAGAAVVGAGLWWQGRRGIQPVGYAIALLLAAIVVTAVRYATFPFERIVISTGPALVLVGLRVLALLVLVNALAGVMTWRLTQQVRQTQEALDTARQQQIALVRADEAVREQMATLLHDQVQSSLIAVCLRLRSLTGKVPEAERAVLISAVDRLEQVRSLDVRTAVRRLSPSLDEVDLQSAIEELATTYEPAVVVDINVDPALDNSGVDSQVRLAAYRIIEQALMNAVVHGSADRIDVEVALAADGVRVSVTDNGHGLPSGDLEEGMGLLLISTWTRALDGSWNLRSIPDGTRLRADLPSQL